MSIKKPIKIQTRYYFIVISQQELFKNLLIEEIFREHLNASNALDIGLDFWILFRPKFLTEIYPKILENTLYFTQNKKAIERDNVNYFSVLITRDYEYICWLKLRLGYFEPILLPFYETPEKSRIIADLRFSNPTSSEDVSPGWLKTLKNWFLPESERGEEEKELKVETFTGRNITINGIYGEISKENLPPRYRLLECPKGIENQIHPDLLKQEYSDLLKRIKELKE